MNRQERRLEPKMITGITFVYEYIFTLEEESDDDIGLSEDLERLLEEYGNVDITFEDFQITVKYESDYESDKEDAIKAYIEHFGAIVKSWKTNHKEDEWYYYEKVVE